MMIPDPDDRPVASQRRSVVAVDRAQRWGRRSLRPCHTDP
jgi:hypothetical protein